MPLVFVHGVATRDSPSYKKSVTARDAYFRRYLLPAIPGVPSDAHIFNPYWGDRGARFYWNHACFPKQAAEQLGPEDELADALLNEAGIEAGTNAGAVLLDMARGGRVAEAVDILWAAGGIVVGGEAHSAAKLADDLVQLASLARAYAAAHSKPPWLDQVSSDKAFVVRLQREVSEFARPPDTHSAAPGKESLGLQEIWDRIKEGADRLGSQSPRMVSEAVMHAGRETLDRKATRFLGDAFVYLDGRGTVERRGPIVEIVLEDLLRADAIKKARNEPLIVVAHSFGGEICYDILTHFQPSLEFDCFVTVGSQVALFEELKLFPANKDFIPASPAQRVGKPGNATRWINIYDAGDALGYKAGGVFADVEDYEYNTGAGLLSAHSIYFLRPSLHERLGRRLKGEGA